MKAISETNPTTWDESNAPSISTALHRSTHPSLKTTPSSTNGGSRPDTATALHDSSSELTKTTTNLTKTSQSDFSTPLQSDDRPEDSDNMATDDVNSLHIEDKNQQDSYEMTSVEEESENDEDTFSKTLVCLLKGKGYKLDKDFRKEVLENSFGSTCAMLARAGLHGDKNKLARRVKMELNMIPEDTNTNEKEAMQAISNYEFSEEQYCILCILAGHKMATTTKKMALFFKKKGR